MTRDGLVDVPENALVDEHIAFGLTAQQLAIATGAVLFAAALNLLPLWPPLKVLLIVIVSGPVALAAVLPIRGEPAYRWLLRALGYWRSPKVWRAAVVPAVTTAAPEDVASKRLVRDHVVQEAQTVEESPPGSDGPAADNGHSAASALAAPSPPPSLVARGPSTAEEHRPMDGSPARLRLMEPKASGSDSEAAARREEIERPPSVPYVLPGPRLVSFVSFVGGVGKTTLAVETATLIADRARFRTPDGETLPVRALLIDAARLSAAVGLRLGIDADDLSKAWTYRDWADPGAALDARVHSRHKVDLITLPPHPQLAGLEPAMAEEGGDEFRAAEANSLLDAARTSGYQLVVADLGTVLEDGHRVLLKEAAVVVGVVRPTLESLPDVLRLTNHLRNVGFARKLVIVANQCDDDTELRRFARDADVPLIAAVPVSPRFIAAADRQEPAWRSDPQLAAALLPVARTVWPLDSLAGHHNVTHPLAGIVQRVRSLARRTAR
jgi:MinD-like ATPase involved in chromosome partitioning or flagellar assembly